MSIWWSSNGWISHCKKGICTSSYCMLERSSSNCWISKNYSSACLYKKPFLNCSISCCNRVQIILCISYFMLYILIVKFCLFHIDLIFLFFRNPHELFKFKKYLFNLEYLSTFWFLIICSLFSLLTSLLIFTNKEWKGVFVLNILLLYISSELNNVMNK